ncbi:MAG: T9SS type A sorting domain-containing protein [Flavobacteriales bacterium]|nr:T9SS type A sorting domain-containing protein [Flavobacteriales bacterium]
MKKIYTLTMMMLFACVSQVSAQRYLEEVFDDVTVTNEVQYGTNATVLAYAIFGEAIPENLMMDIYEPEGDTETERPLILFFHTGNFLPHPENGGTGGLRTDSAAVEICSRMARMGYVVASCDYRLGWNPLADTQEDRVSTLINAAYRGVQDARTAARFFRADAIDGDNDYGIDESRIVVWGQGTGGYISMASATLDEYEDILLPKFITEDLIPMVIESINGDIFGTSYGINPFDGDTLCYVNHEGYDSDFQACVNLGGAMGDISWLDADDIPMVSFHVPTDPFAPYEEGTVIVPVVNLPVVEVQGSYIVQQVCTTLGINDVWADSNLDDVWSQAANLNNDGYDGLFPFNRPAEMPADSGPWEWWDPETNPNSDNGFLTNPDASAEKGRAYIDSIQGYAASRLSCALALPENPCAGGGPVNDLCDSSIDVNDLFGGAVNETQMSETFSNEGASAEDDLDIGYDCFDDNNGEAPSIENTVWFTFTGDGELYNIATSDCGGTADFLEGDTQIAIYEGSCNDLGPAGCNEDIDFDGGNYYSGLDFQTEDGVEYYIMVDGYDYTAFDLDPATGEFCLEITQTIVSVEEIDLIGLQLFPNPATSVVNVSANSNIDRIEVYSIQGKLVDDITPRATQVEMSVESWETGVYLIQVTANGITATQRFIKQ